MSDLKKMYRTLAQDPFPGEMTIRLGDQEFTFTKRTWTIDGEEKGLRYGENPDQPAALFELTGGGIALDGVALRGPGEGLVSALTEEHMLQAGKHPGKINLTDVDNGINILQYLTAKPAAVILKHNNPSGAAWTDEGIAVAVERAFRSDRIAAFGGAVVVNRPVDETTAELINSSYFEVVAAPAYEGNSLEILKKRKNLRILQIPGLANLEKLVGVPFLDLKSLNDGGIVAQVSFRNRILCADDFIPAEAEKDGATYIARKPNESETEDLIFAWAVEAGVTSNSVIFAKDGVTTAIGTGEQDRVGCVELTIHKAYTKYADLLCFDEEGCSLYEFKLRARTDEDAAKRLADIEARTSEARGGLAGSVLVSDGFFPFRDGVDVALAQGVTAIAQPGGSIRDWEIIGAVNEATPQVAMVFTGQRSFKH
ncbi:phosphoribosylaminoimidazolecarboxamide formyltransferase/IMP cyclohydrolase [Desulfobaculum xiamenense]|uniref:Phosphoribosylaminoimidazolecarboxamide formyltransferase/IMP cyclohydrolase n=1 Tax=Desulfobaculum xiamenense TaxID=995050 RepID=A0A846QS16_9BACT|nr:IMP cyclohydrolase [Desulfobaculum xiamenense]NJB69163.1 phosphoribosylaminoimidazolecarboxamide formyltransferase/IMP cyclohydrolase [Desulfobaculum xiamenense]